VRTINKRGFTLVEIIVFTGIMGVMMVGLVGVLLNSLRARNRSRLEDIVDFNGTWVGEQLKWNLLNATYQTVECTPSSVTFENKKDLQKTTLGCDPTGKIASSSEGGVVVPLSANEVSDSCESGSINVSW
jgi:type II secretory pathway pseudopilin PulG